MSLGANILKFREKKSLSQEDIFEKIGVTRQTYSSWENDKITPRKEKLYAIAEILGVSISDLYGIPEENQSANENSGERSNILLSDVNKENEWLKNTLNAYIKQAELNVRYIRVLEEENKRLTALLKGTEDKVET